MNFDPNSAAVDIPAPHPAAAAKPEPDDDFDNEILVQPEGSSCSMEPGCTSCE